jgi:hypothetical protein
MVDMFLLINTLKSWWALQAQKHRQEHQVNYLIKVFKN